MEGFDTSASSRNWYIVNDDVMGGISTSSAAIIEPGVMAFSGTVSLENNGGFASVRSVRGDWNTAGTSGVRIRVMGDGQTYRFEVNTDQTYAGYDVLFTTVAGQWQEFSFRYDEFEADYRGFPVDAPSIDPSRITSLGFMIRDYQAGQFWLGVDWVKGIAPEL